MEQSEQRKCEGLDRSRESRWKVGRYTESARRVLVLYRWNCYGQKDTHGSADRGQLSPRLLCERWIRRAVSKRSLYRGRGLLDECRSVYESGQRARSAPSGA